MRERLLPRGRFGLRQAATPVLAWVGPTADCRARILVRAVQAGEAGPADAAVAASNDVAAVASVLAQAWFDPVGRRVNALRRRRTRSISNRQDAAPLRFNTRRVRRRTV
jgi:hypothetical protein